ncbi:MAG: septal ring lytic transglycosylase RlpA family protein, partial [Leptospiraceae bacterium]|nr:septal ring lytic transglycosylase RlpA family protein [Leptospiraceae bacterium]
QADPEASFFNEMSRQDPALQNKPSAVSDEFRSTETAHNDQDCQCKTDTSTKSDTRTDSSESETRLDRYADNDTVSDRRIQLDQEAVKPENETATAVTATSSAGDSSDHRLSGVASWYGRDFDGRPTASGDIFDSSKLTAAHKTLPLGSIALVRNLENNKEILVTINDRGPYVGDRVLDISEYGAELLGYKDQGLTPVQISVVRMGNGKSGVAKRGATYDFFGPESGYISQGSGAGDDPQANREIDALLTKNQNEAERYVAPAVKDPRKDQDQGKLIRPESQQQNLSVQIGIFADSRNALNLKRYLDSSLKWSEPIYVYRRGDQYVVKMGSFSERSAAEALKGRLILEGFQAFLSARPR